MHKITRVRAKRLFLCAVQRKFAFPIDFSERKLLLAFVDLLLVNLSLLWVLTVRSDFSLSWAIMGEHWPWFLILSGLWLAIGLILDIYDLARAARRMDSVWVTSGAALLTSLFYSFIPYWTPTLPNRRLELLLFLLLTTVGTALWRLLYASLFIQPVFRQTALLIGTSASAHALVQAIADSQYDKEQDQNEYEDQKINSIDRVGYRILGIISEEPREEGLISKLPVLGSPDDLVSLARTFNPDEIIVVTHLAQLKQGTLQAILNCHELGIRITSITSLYERMSGRILLEHAEHNLDVVLPMSQPGYMRLYLIIRHLFELVIALCGLPLLLILMPFIWLANHFTAPGDLFYRQKRVGKSGKLFEIIKFRTMVMDAEKYTGVVWTSKNDPRMTLVGGILRQTRIDELPQLWNILKGEMSFIGPRPERAHFVTLLAKEMPFYRARHAVKPGLTGWAQVKYRYGASVEDALIKLQYDLYYIKHQSPYLDLLILLQTIQVVLGGKGR